jgi:polysaccharide biosynthesis transport protein
MQEQRSEALDSTAILRGMWRRHKKLTATVFLAIAIPAVITVYYTRQAIFVSSATIAIESSALEQLPFFRDLPKRDNVEIHMALLKSRSLGEGVVEALPKETFDELLAKGEYTDYLLVLGNMIKKWKGNPITVLSPQQRALAELQNARMEFTQDSRSPGIFFIKASGSSPRIAMDLVNTHIQVLLSRTRSGDQEQTRKAREFLEQQIQQSKENLHQAEESMTKFQQQRGRISLQSETQLDLVKLSQVESALAEATANREVVAARLTNLRQVVQRLREKDLKTASSGGKEQSSAAPASENSIQFNAFRAAQDRVTKLEEKIAELRVRYTEAHPQLQAAQEELRNEQARLAKMAKELPATAAPRTSGQPAASTLPTDRAEAERLLVALETEEGNLTAKVETLKLQVGRMRKGLRNVSEDELGYSQLSRTVEANRNLLSVLSEKLMTARIREQGEPVVIRILDPASYPASPSGSKTFKSVLMALAAAMALAVGAAFGLEYLRQPVETDEDVRKTTGLQVLGHVGIIGATVKSRKGEQASGGRSTRPIWAPPTGILLELYRAIRANMEMERLKHPFQIVLITSPGPAEGKSTTTLNISHVFRELGLRVLILEADLRRPSLQRALSLASTDTFANYLSGAATFEKVVHQLPSGVCVVLGQAVKDDPAALLASAKTKTFLHEARERFDVVLVDSPPLLAVPDNVLLLPSVDRAVLVVKASATTKRDLRNAKAMLLRTDTQILGVVLNQAHSHDVPYYRPNYQKYYHTPKVKPVKEEVKM